MLLLFLNPPHRQLQRDRQAGRLPGKAISNLDATLNLPPHPEQQHQPGVETAALPAPLTGERGRAPRPVQCDGRTPFTSCILVKS